MTYEIFVSHFLKDKRAVVTNSCGADIPLGSLFHTIFWATYVREGEVFRCMAKSEPQAIQLVLTSSNIFRQQVGSIPRGYSAAVTFHGTGIDIMHDLLNVRPKGAFVKLHAGRC